MLNRGIPAGYRYMDARGVWSNSAAPAATDCPHPVIDLHVGCLIGTAKQAGHGRFTAFDRAIQTKIRHFLFLFIYTAHDDPCDSSAF